MVADPAGLFGRLPKRPIGRISREKPDFKSLFPVVLLGFAIGSETSKFVDPIKMIVSFRESCSPCTRISLIMSGCLKRY
jgi:hypothetical protein